MAALRHLLWLLLLLVVIALGGWVRSLVVGPPKTISASSAEAILRDVHYTSMNVYADAGEVQVTDANKIRECFKLLLTPRNAWGPQIRSKMEEGWGLYVHLDGKLGSDCLWLQLKGNQPFKVDIRGGASLSRLLSPPERDELLLILGLRWDGQKLRLCER
jgi:hypothetical protein